MQYGEAFRKLGYEVAVPRQDWSAENADGVCLTLWAKELDSGGGRPWIDTRLHADDNDIWRDKPGNRKRIAHLARARSQFGDWVDVVLVHGVPGESYGSASPWIVKDRKNMRWKVEGLDEDTGHFIARTHPAP